MCNGQLQEDIQNQDAEVEHYILIMIIHRLNIEVIFFLYWTRDYNETIDMMQQQIKHL